MKTVKMSLATIQGKLSRAESIMAGSLFSLCGNSWVGAPFTGKAEWK
jgi:hypothetical protein